MMGEHDVMYNLIKAIQKLDINRKICCDNLHYLFDARL